MIPSAARLRRDWLVLVAPFAAGAAAVLLATRHGMLRSPDSATYLYVAEQLRSDPWSIARVQVFDQVADAGRFPPLYPAVLAVTGADLNELTERTLNAATAGTTLALVSALTRRAAGWGAAIGAAATVLLSRSFVLRLHAFTMSDALSLMLTLVAIASLHHAVRSDSSERRWPWLWLSGLAAGLAFSTRYVGLAVVALVLLGSWHMAPRARRASSVAFVAAGAALPALWLIVQSPPNQVGGRGVAWFGIDLGRVADLPRTLALYLLPDVVVSGAAGAPIVIGVAVGVTVAAVWSLRVLLVRDPDEQQSLLTLLVGFAWLHLLVLVGAAVLVDPWIDPSDRHVLPAWVVSVIVAWTVLDRRRRTGLPTRAVHAVVAVLLLSGAAITASTLRAPSASYFNLDREMAESDLFRHVSRRPPEDPVYTNRPDFFYVHSRWRTYHLPRDKDLASGRANPNHTDEMRQMAAALADHGSVVLFLVAAPPTTPIDDFERIGLRVIHRATDGVVMACTSACSTAE